MRLEEEELRRRQTVSVDSSEKILLQVKVVKSRHDRDGF